MNKDNLKSAAVSACLDIYGDYTESEVERWAPKSVYYAWTVGRDIATEIKQENAERLKGFVL